MKTPSDLPECYQKLRELLGEASTQTLKSKNKEDLIDYHLDQGLYIRNNWLYSKDSQLMNFFEVHKPYLFHHDSISQLIIELFWEHLQGKDYDEDKIVERLVMGSSYIC